MALVAGPDSDGLSVMMLFVILAISTSDLRLSYVFPAGTLV